MRKILCFVILVCAGTFGQYLPSQGSAVKSVAPVKYALTADQAQRLKTYAIAYRKARSTHNVVEFDRAYRGWVHECSEIKLELKAVPEAQCNMEDFSIEAGR